MKIEQYTFILKHEFVDGDMSYPLEEPIILRMACDRSQGGIPIQINEMLDRFRWEILNRMQNDQCKASHHK